MHHRYHRILSITAAICVLVMNTQIVMAAPTPVSIEDAKEKIIEKNQRFYLAEDGLHFNVPVKKVHTEWYDVCYQLINTFFRGCDYSELGGTAYLYDRMEPEVAECIIRDDQIAILMKRQNTIDEWCGRIAKQIFQNGMTREDALYIAYFYITDHFSYDFELAGSGDAKRQMDAQGAYYAIQNGKGICASLSKLFRSLVETIPFDSNGFVSWTTPEAQHLSVTIIRNSRHEWTSILFDGIEYYYDCSVENAHQMKGYKRTVSDVMQGENANLYELSRTRYD